MSVVSIVLLSILGAVGFVTLMVGLSAIIAVYKADAASGKEQ